MSTSPSSPVPPPADYPTSNTNNANTSSTSPESTPADPPAAAPSEPLTDAQLEAQLKASTLKFYKQTYLLFLTYYTPRLTLISLFSFVLKLYLLPWLFVGLRWLGKWILWGFEKLLFGLAWIASWGVVYAIGIGIFGGVLVGFGMWLWLEWPRVQGAYPKGSKWGLCASTSLGAGWMALRWFKTSIVLATFGVAFWIRSRLGSKKKIGRTGSKKGRSDKTCQDDLDAVDEATLLRLLKLREASEARRRTVQATSTSEGTTKMGEQGEHVEEKKDDDEQKNDDLMDREAERWARKAREEMLREELTRRARGAGGVASSPTRSEDVDAASGVDVE
ncbi:BQ2448_1588 [Microbotryum intermedium]|uniref:BQ2448_1588 protein n=1 Tax=Microbotryum intermedium TaxID=269621 RepID=A0A238FE85_9BASI|nr:BQ2448_1588 [Microbotryum intermedium]